MESQEFSGGAKLPTKDDLIIGPLFVVLMGIIQGYGILTVGIVHVVGEKDFVDVGE